MANQSTHDDASNASRKLRKRAHLPVHPVDTSFEFPPSYEEKEPLSTPHTVTVLLCVVASVFYALYYRSHYRDGTIEQASMGTDIKHGVIAALLVGLVFCAEHLRDTLFKRPHPAYWRLVTGFGLFYFMFCTFALFQKLDVLQMMMKEIDPKHALGPGGYALNASYGENCELTIPNIRGAMDIFVAAHFFGWMAKISMMRDIWIAMTLSFLFELMEYSFEFLQPNFVECWWDHWILDFLICNTGGILVGYYIMKKFGAKEYNWPGMLRQFTPIKVDNYHWRLFSDVKRFFYVIVMVTVSLIIELNAFFLKFILNIQSPSKINLFRLVLWWMVGMCALRDYYSFMTDKRIKRVGSTCWIALAMCFMETALVVKFGVEIPAWQDAKPPMGVVIAWTVAFTVFAVASVAWFGFILPQRKKEKARRDLEDERLLLKALIREEEEAQEADAIEQDSVESSASTVPSTPESDRAAQDTSQTPELSSTRKRRGSISETPSRTPSKTPSKASSKDASKDNVSAEVVSPTRTPSSGKKDGKKKDTTKDKPVRGSPGADDTTPKKKFRRGSVA